MKEYSEYQDTGLPWLPCIPSHWGMKKIKHLFSERSEKGFPREPLLVASQNMGVVPKNVYGNRTVEAQKDLHLLKLVKKGDFVISLRSFQGGIEYAYYQGIISPAYTIMIPHSEIVTGYFRHLAKSAPFIELLKLCVTGIREGQNIDYEKLKNHKIPVPSYAEQDQIVRFLDWKSTGIDRLIATKKKQIEALDRLKQAEITRAVTRGLDQSAPLKDSGNSWLENIPIHWEVVHLRRASTVILGKMLSPNPSNSDDSLEEYVCAKDVHFHGVDLTNLKRMWFSCQEKKQYKLQDGDLLIVEGGAGAGNSAIVSIPPCRDVYIQNSIHIVRAKKGVATNEFICYWLTSLVSRGYMKNICSVGRVPKTDEMSEESGKTKKRA